MKTRPNLTDLQTIQTLLRRLNVEPSRARGQNFLVDPAAVDRIVEFIEPDRTETIVEIGPGLGVLTHELAAASAALHVIEAEPAFASYISESVPGLTSERIHRGDVRTFSGETLVGSSEAQAVLVGNLPYSLSTDIILWFLENRSFFSRACFLLQREFAERIAADPGNREYGMLTVFRTRYASAELGPTIRAESFFPRPKVDSRLVRLIPRNKAVAVEDEANFRKVVKAAFSSKRKTILNSLLGSPIIRSKEDWRKVLSDVAIDPMRRAETLTVEEFTKLAGRLAQG